MAVVIALLLAQLQLAEIRGTVGDDGGAALAGARVELTDPLGGAIAARDTDAAGRFAFTGISPGRYSLLAHLQGFDTVRHDVVVTHAVPTELALRLRLRTAVDIVVDDAVDPPVPATRMSLAGDSIRRVPIANAGKGLQDLVATLPGWSTEDNGLLHARGTDDGFLYVIDGIPVYERLDQLSGVAPDAASVDSINVMTGLLPAEYGYKAGGVIAVRSKSAATGWSGSIGADAGSERGASLAAAAGGPLGRALAISIGASARRSDRFLDPIHPDNLHNAGHAAAGSSAVTWTSPGRTIVTLSGGGAGSHYDVPNTEEQEEAGQGQRQRLRHRSGTANWQQVWAPSLYTQVAAYGRRANADLAGSDHDVPLFAIAHRTADRIGAIGSVTWRRGAHTIKSGIDLQRLALRESLEFAVTDRQAAREAGFTDAALAFDRARPFAFTGRATPTLFSAYAQDDWTLGDRMTINAGVRIDRAALLLPRRSVGPRAGLTYRAADRTVLRGSIGRFFQPPQPEYLLLSSSKEARVLSPFAGDRSGGGADIEPETQWAYEAGVAHDLARGIRLDVAAWHRSIRNAADPNVFGGTTIVFPNAVAHGTASGVDLRVEVRRHRGWSGYASLGAGRIRQRGPITGGLFLEDDVAEIDDGMPFTPDHDQALTASAGVTWTPASSLASFSLVARHESGTPIGDADDDDLAARPGADLVDLDRGRVAPRTVVAFQGSVPLWARLRWSAVLQFAVHNLLDARYAYNFGNPFSGTHFGAPRTGSAGVRIRF